jgi:hypothetical protein
MEKYLKLTDFNDRLVKVNSIVKLVVSTNDLVITYENGATVTLGHASPPTANVAELEDAIVLALATKWNDIVHPVTLTEAPTSIS